MKPLVFVLLVALSTSKIVAQLPTIDLLTNHTDPYWQTYSPASGQLLAFARNDYYELSDGTFWNSGAGTHTPTALTYTGSLRTGDVIEYYFAPIADGILYQHTDFNLGEHSAQGTLGYDPARPITLRAYPGQSAQASWVGHTTLLANDMTSYGPERFHFYSTPVGSAVHFAVMWTLEEGIWAEDTFLNDFSYTARAVVHFDRPFVPVPEPASFSLLATGALLFGILFRWHRRRTAPAASPSLTIATSVLN